ncbi:LPS export ABC transporter permease LptF [Marinomonas ostreistagni]|uniref:Lipopolysaccharide export system permease protein LptF n=1 Tax=Marinomonas ostreistagni TaxID=359209 RepID=A0ABS0ZB86_9GAMM|nr:LPS export ABC transporter permease LptF [Marinomonas ostreistagni]MBJ7550902.1 LPS export ABC transporter permease LptF [Marinomonas ostreistagni]
MKLFRYLAKEVLVSTAAVTLILLLVILSGRIFNYLGRVADGRMSFDFLFILLGLHIPSFIQVILPLAFFLSLLLAYGRLYIENEMSILFASGISKLKLAGYTLGIAFFITVLSAAINFWISPSFEYKAQEITQEQDKLTAFDFLQPGKFEGHGQRATYIERFTADEDWMENLFISDVSQKSKQYVPSQTLAQYGELVRFPEHDGLQYLVLKNGVRYEGKPGTGNYSITTFDTYAIRIEDSPSGDITDEKAQPTLKLLQSNEPKLVAELHWRIGLVIIVPILAVIGLSLSQVNPRQGRFFKMLPAIILLITYLGLLIWGRTALEKQIIPLSLGMWWVHGIFALIAAYTFMMFNQVFSRKAAKLPNLNGDSNA